MKTESFIKAAALTLSMMMIGSPVYAADVNDAPSGANAQTTQTEQSVEAPVAKVTSNGQETNLKLDGDLGNENSEDILGESWYYGIVANTLEFNGEAETDFAVKHFKHQNSGTSGQTGVTDKGDGSKEAFFVVGDIDSEFKIKGISAKVTTPAKNNDKFTNATDNNGTITFNDISENVIDQYVDDVLSDAEAQSKRLAELDSVKEYSSDLPQNQMVIDITAAGKNTVYLNADKWSGLKNELEQSLGVKIIKNKDQKIVINYPESKTVNTDKIVFIQDGQTYDSTELANKSTRDIAPIAQDIILNMPVATSVKLNDTTGIIFAPKARVETYGVDGGWINCDDMHNDCEWHMVNGYLPDKDREVLGDKRPRRRYYGKNEVTDVKPGKSDDKTTEDKGDKPEQPKDGKTTEDKDNGSEKPNDSKTTEDKGNKPEQPKDSKTTEDKGNGSEQPKDNKTTEDKTEQTKHNDQTESKTQNDNSQKQASDKENAKKADVPKTGDSTNILIYSVFGLGAALALVTLGIRRKKMR